MLLAQAENVLQQVKAQLQEQLTRTKYELLIRPLRVVESDDDSLTLATNNELLRQWLLDACGEMLRELAELASGRAVRIQVVVIAPEWSESLIEPVTSAPTSLSAAPDFRPADLHEFGPQRSGRPLLNPRYTFEQFVVGPGSQFAYSAALQVAQRPGGAYNPLLVYGGAGLGKTHLLHAIGHQVHGSSPGASVVYATAEKFTNDYIEHVRTGRMPQLHSRYRSADLLLLDDLQFLSGKTETAAEFFHTLLHLLEAGRQVVVSADRPPRQLKGLDERLVSRLSAGLACDLQPPALEARIGILKSKAALEHVSLPDDVCRYIAERAGESVRELEGALVRLLAFCDFSSSAPSVEVAARVLSDLLAGQASHLSLSQIIRAVCEYFNVAEALLLSPNRSKRVALARMVAMYLARQHTNMTLSQIGSELGGRDHSTISHGASKIEAELSSDPYVEQAVSQISKMLR